VHISKEDQAEARVLVRRGEEELSAEAKGVGPFDAIIKALKSACEELSFSLSGYKVDIRGQGTNAVVYVELKLVQEGMVSVGRGTSPDIIQASVEAFEDAYNGF
jgi:threonine synthase